MLSVSNGLRTGIAFVCHARPQLPDVSLKFCFGGEHRCPLCYSWLHDDTFLRDSSVRLALMSGARALAWGARVERGKDRKWGSLGKLRVRFQPITEA